MADVHPVEAAVRHRATLRRRLEECVKALVTAIGQGTPFDGQLTALRELLTYEVLPHVEATEHTILHRAATARAVTLSPQADRSSPHTMASSARAGALVRMMRSEHHSLVSLTDDLHAETDGIAVATAAEWIATLFAGHIAKENELLVPLPVAPERTTAGPRR